MRYRKPMAPEAKHSHLIKRKQPLFFQISSLVLVGLCSLWSVWSPVASDQAVIADPTNFTLTTQGKQLYAEHCAECHGVELEGQPNWTKRNSEGKLPAPPHDASGHTWHHSDELLFTLTKLGVGAIAGPNYPTDMPAYSDVMSDQEVIAIIAFIKSTWPLEIQEAQSRTNF